MTIIAGGKLSKNALNNFLVHSPALTNTKLDQWMHLVRNPKNADDFLICMRIAQKDKTANTNSMRAEYSHPSDKTPWGEWRWYIWKFIVPDDYAIYAGESGSVVCQLHDVAAALQPRNPTWAVSLKGNKVISEIAYDGIPTTELHEMEFNKGDEIEVIVQAFWSDGVSVPANQGVFRQWVNGALVSDRVNMQNTWGGAQPDPNPPYLKAGVYMSDTALWWNGKAKHILYDGCAVGDSTETIDSMRTSIL